MFRLAFLAATLAGGIGPVAYALMWVFLPLRVDAPAGTRLTGADLGGLLGLAALGLGLVLGASALGLPIRASWSVPVLLFGAGVAVLWRQSDDEQRAYLVARAQAGAAATGLAGDRRVWLRVVVGLLLVGAGLLAAIGPRVDLVTGLRLLAAAGAVLAGLALIALPWVAGWAKRARAERYEAIRAQERAALAARVHDSVLQTLTLIQRRADDRAEVLRLARAEERALRGWLYAPVGPTGTLSAGLAAMVAEVEADYEARIELVAVGDVAVDQRVAALLAATREAVVNAAKHAGAAVSVYVEVSDGEVEVNVKDRGRGFDLAEVGADRHGLRESIVGRLAGVGGWTVVRSAPGEGTEIRMQLPIGGVLDA